MPDFKRNDPCPCGSGKKYKACCGKKRAMTPSVVRSMMVEGGAPEVAADAIVRLVEWCKEKSPRLSFGFFPPLAVGALKTLGVSARGCVGHAVSGRHLSPGSYFWLEVMGKPVDPFCDQPYLTGEGLTNPVIMGRDVMTGGPANMVYGFPYVRLDTASIELSTSNMRDFVEESLSRIHICSPQTQQALFKDAFGDTIDTDAALAALSSSFFEIKDDAIWDDSAKLVAKFRSSLFGFGNENGIYVSSPNGPRRVFSPSGEREGWVLRENKRKRQAVPTFSINVN